MACKMRVFTTHLLCSIGAATVDGPTWDVLARAPWGGPNFLRFPSPVCGEGAATVATGMEVVQNTMFSTSIQRWPSGARP
jgi:hypothetical protein